MNIDDYESNIFEHIKNLDFPRRSGTDGERKAANYISSVFKKNGYEPIREKFKYVPNSIARSIIIIILLTGFLTLSILNLVFFNSIIFSIIFLALPIIILISFLRIDILFKRMIKGRIVQFSKIDKLETEKKLSNNKFIECENIFVEYCHPEYEKHIYLACHYDSISLKLSTNTLIISSLIGISSFLTYYIIYSLDFILNLFNIDFFTSYWYIFYISFLLSIIFLNIILIGRIFRSNVSHGAIDDGTGVGIILELSNIIKKIKPKLKITLITFSSEEVGLYGSSYHFYKHQDNFESNMQIISIDMIGEIPPLSYVENINPITKIKTDKKFNQDLKEIANNYNIKLEGINFLYPGSDFAVWLLQGYKSNWIYTKSKLIHSKNDNLSKINKKLISECFTLFVEYLKKYI